MRFLLALLPLTLVIALNTIADRPYWIDENDMEHDSYYNSRLVFEDLPIRSMHHPGTPVFFLGGALMHATGSEAGGFLTASTILCALLTSVAVWTFMAMLAPHHPQSVLVLALAAALSWPGVLHHLDYYGADSLIVSFSLMAVALFWKYTNTGSTVWLVICGIALGTILAIKLSALPLAVAIGVGTIAVTLRARRGRRALLTSVAILATSTLGTLGAWLAPIAPSVPGVISLTIHRPEIKTPKTWEAFADAWSRVVPRLLTFEWPAIALLIVCIGAAIVARRKPRHGWALAAFGFVSVAGLAYVVLTGGRQEFALFGIQVRNSTPIWMAMPLIVLSVVHKSARWQWPVAALVVGWPLTMHLRERDEFVTETRRAATQTLTSLERIAADIGRPPGRIAIWDGSPGTLRGMSFHCWGNWRYAAGAYSDRVGSAYGPWTCLHLRNLRAQVPNRVDNQASRWGRVGRWLWSIRRKSPDLDPSLFAGAAPVSLAVLPASEWELESRGAPWQLLISRLGWSSGTVRMERIGSVDWAFVIRGNGSVDSSQGGRIK